MIRHRCEQCGQHINRTDHFFEASNGKLCDACRSGRNAKYARDSFADLPPLTHLSQAGGQTLFQQR